MRAVTGKPIKLLGMGEKMDALEDFHPSRVASHFLGLGDVVSLVEKAQELQGRSRAPAKRLSKGQFDLNDLADQMRKISKMGGIQALIEVCSLAWGA